MHIDRYKRLQALWSGTGFVFRQVLFYAVKTEQVVAVVGFATFSPVVVNYPLAEVAYYFWHLFQILLVYYRFRIKLVKLFIR
jgi:hypothetical protein